MKYIDAEKLIAEIERRKQIHKNNIENGFPDEANKITEDNNILSLITSLQQEQPDNIIQWTGNNLKEVIGFTGKSPRLGEWFNSWEEYENYVHSHNDILKLFCEGGSHYEVPVGAWIVKTPDGYNVPSVAKYIQQEQPEPSCKSCGFYENNCPFIRGKFTPYPNKVCKDYTYSVMKEQPEVDLEKEEFVGMAESPSKTFPRVNEFDCGSSYRH